MTHPPLHSPRPANSQWRTVTALPLGVALMCLATFAHGFEAREHLLMSNAALAAAIGYVKSRQPTPPTRQLTKALAAAGLLLDPPKPGPDVKINYEKKPFLEKGQYGTLTECVDYFLFPEKMLAFAWRPSRIHAAINISDTVLPDGIDTFVHPALMSQCQDEGTTYIQASHSNHAHFQQDLVISIRLYHALALGIARDEGNPYAALIVNAISDHYLQDFFAPGHLVTPRDRLTDLPATAMHDLANQMGAIFNPKVAAPIVEMLTYLCGAKIDLQEPRPSQGCSPPEPMLSVLEGIGLKPGQLGPIVQDIVRGKPMLFRGDGQLNYPPQDEQRLMLLAVQMRSIVDILDVTNDNNFLKFSFKYVLKSGEPTETTTPFGRYDFHSQGMKFEPILAGNTGPQAAKAAEAGSSSTQSTIFSVCSFGSCKDKLYPLRERSPILSASFQRESENKGSHEGRNVWAFEFSPGGTSFDWSKLSHGYLTGVEVAPVFGYLYYQHGGRSGHGPSFRLPFYVPETEFSLGPYARWLDYADRGGNSRKLSYGLRMDAGFSTYATFFLGAGSDYGSDGFGQLTRSWLWTAGVRLGFPLSRVLSIFNR